MSRTTPHNPISSKDNDTIKYLHSLSEPKHRKKEQAYLIEGIKIVEEALRNNARVKMVVAAPSLVPHHGRGVLKLAQSRGIGILWISERLMDMLSESKTPQPLLAVVPIKQHTEEVLINAQAGLIVVAHRLQDPGNLGTIIRTAEAVGASGVVITTNTVDPYNAKAVRASMGSILRLPVVPTKDVSAFIIKCKQKEFQIAAMALNGETVHFEADLTKPTVVILGQEGEGLPPEILSPADLHVRIPLAKTIDSLNVATAAAVVLYEAMRQRIQRDFVGWRRRKE